MIFMPLCPILKNAKRLNNNATTATESRTGSRAFFASKIGYYFVANMLERNKNKESHADTAASILENINNCISQSQIVIV